MGDSVETQQVLLEIILNKVRIFPSSEDADYTTVDGKKIDGLNPIYLSQIGVESVRVAFGEGGFDIEVVLFDPSMAALDIIIYGVPFADNVIKVTLGWMGDGLDENKRTFEGNLVSVRPDITAGGVRYTLNYYYSWVVYGAIKSDNEFVDFITRVYDDGYFTITPYTYSYQDDPDSDVFKVILRSFTTDYTWDMYEDMSLLLSYSLMELLFERFMRKDVVVNVNGSPVVLFKSEYVAYVRGLMRRVKNGEIELARCVKVINKLLTGNYIFPDIGGFENYRAYYKLYVHGSGETGSELMADSATLYNSVAHVSVFNNPDDCVLGKPDFSGCFTPVHILLIFAALYGMDVEIGEGLLRSSQNGTKDSLSVFLNEKVMSIPYAAYRDCRDTDVFGYMRDVFEFATNKLDSLVRTSSFGINVLSNPPSGYTQKEYAEMIGGAFFADRLHVTIVYILRKVFAEGKSAEFSDDELKGVMDARRGNVPSEDVAKSYAEFAINSYDESLGFHRYKFSQDFYSDLSYTRNPGDKLLGFLQDMFKYSGFYSPTGFSDSADEDPDLLRLFVDIAPSKNTGKSVIIVKGEQVDMRFKPTHIFTYPRQSIKEKVTSFEVVSDGGVFLPYYGGILVNDFSSIPTSLTRKTKSTDFKPSLVEGETVCRLYSDVNLDKIKELVKKTEDINAKVMTETARAVISKLVYPFYSSVKRREPFDIATYTASLVSFQRVGMIQADMEIIGDVNVDLFDYIFISIVTENYTMYHLSGVYLITHVEHSVAVGTSFTTKLAIQRMGSYARGIKAIDVANLRKFKLEEEK